MFLNHQGQRLNYFLTAMIIFIYFSMYYQCITRNRSFIRIYEVERNSLSILKNLTKI